MIEATNAGHELPDLDQEALARYLGRSLSADNPGLNQQAFLCRALAAFGKPEISRQSFLLDRVDQLDPAARAHLSAAWLASGRKDKAKLALPADTLRMEPTPRTTGGRLTSPVAQDGILLSSLLSLDPEHPWIPQLVDRLEQARKAGLWRSTLDDGLALSALCRYQAGVKREPGDFSGTVSSGDLLKRSFTSESSADFAFEGSQPIRLTSHGTGSLYLSVRTEGLAIANQVSERDNGIIARRRWLDSEGNVLRDWTIDGSEKAFPKVKLKVGDLVRVEVRLSARGRGTVRNIAIVDSLPGGMEVENPRLATSADTTNQTVSEPDRVEFLDDRVVLFASARGRSDTFSYSMRATTQGEFSVPPVQATCMYDSSLSSLHGSGQLEIKPMR
jgi:uncharacterized protein YfaS (alpha-2-macroglobulin family)